MTLVLTTESGRIYKLELDHNFWSRSPHFRHHVIWELKAGQKMEWPTLENQAFWRDGVPEIGEHLYVRGYDEWYVSTKIVSIEEVDDEH